LQETGRIEDQLNRSFRGEAWHGLCLQDLLRDVTFSQAGARPIANAHGIWEIVLHITAWIDAVRRRLEGAHEKLRGSIATLDPERLDQKVPGKPYSIYFMLDGVIQHNLYHAGQIALLKKA